MDSPVERDYADLVAARAQLAAAKNATTAQQDAAAAPEKIKPALLVPTPQDAAVVFDPAFYRMTNPDVSAADVDPWLHFQLHGVHEARDPHPAVSCRWLARFIPARQDVSVLDQYLIDPRYWLLQPHAGIDIEGYAASGGWTGARHPLLEALDSRALANWVSGLQTAGEGREETLLRETLLFLTARHPGLTAHADEIVDRSAFSHIPPYRVFPGVAVGNAVGQMQWLSPSPDAARDDIVAVDGRAVSWSSGQVLDAESVILTPAGTCPTLAQLSRMTDALVVPGDGLTERAIRLARQVVHLPLRVWPFDTSLHVRTTELITSIPVATGPTRLPRRRWPFRSGQPLAVSGQLEGAQLTVSSSPDPSLRDRVETGIEGLAVLAQVERGRVRLSSDLGHVRPLLSELLEYGR